MKLTEQQARLLRILPDPPSDGRFCKGPRRRTAEALERKGLARYMGSGQWAGAYFVRTELGAKVAAS